MSGNFTREESWVQHTPEISDLQNQLKELKQDIKNKIIKFEKLSKKDYIITKEEAFDEWVDIVNEALAAADVPEHKITFDFVPTKLPKEKERRFLWLGVHDEGIQSWNTDLVGEDIRDAIIRSIVKNPYDFVIYYEFRQVFEELYPKKNIKDPINFTILDHVADIMLNSVKNSSVDGDSSQQIIVFDITDNSDVKLIYPEITSCEN